MVNPAKRMRGLQPKLLQIQYGKGAAVLPPPPSPQLTRLVLRYPRRTWTIDNQGPRTFAKDCLPRLKYHNPALPIRVEDSTTKSNLELTFESNDRSSLEALRNKPWADPKDVDRFKDQWTEIESKPQPAADPKAPSTTSPPSPAFTRNARLNLGKEGAPEIWKWFKKTTSCQEVTMSAQDEELRRELQSFFQKAEKDRQLVKAGIEAMRKEKQELKRAREAAERLTSES